jgi:hypothetical protein
VPALDALKPLVNASAKGVVRDRTTADGVRQMLTAAAAQVTSATDAAAHRTTVRSTRDLVVYRFSLQQR